MKKALIATLVAGSVTVASAGYNMAVCKGCHGQNFEKKALGASKVVKDMEKADIVAALKGYKDGTYGGAMKGTMLGQVAGMNEADMSAVADEIKAQ